MCANVQIRSIFSLCHCIFGSVYYLSAVYALHLTVRNQPLLNLEINIANNKKWRNSWSFLVFTHGPFSIMFCLGSSKHTHVHSSLRNENSVRNMYRLTKNSQWAHLYLEIWDCEKNKIIHSYAHTRARSLSQFRPVNVLTLQTQSYTHRENAY